MWDKSSSRKKGQDFKAELGIGAEACLQEINLPIHSWVRFCCCFNKVLACEGDQRQKEGFMWNRKAMKTLTRDSSPEGNSPGKVELVK